MKMALAAPLVLLVVVLLVVALFWGPRPVRASLQPPGVIVPLYSPPGSQWDAVASAKADNPSVSIIAIVNPQSGPGTSLNASFAQGVQTLRKAGIEVAGYVATGYASVPVQTVETWISNYAKWYGVDGILFDEMPSVPGYESYYQTLGSYAKSIGIQYTIGNPGAPIPSSYSGILDIYVVVEQASLVDPVSTLEEVGGAPASSLAGIMYSVPTLDQDYVRSATASLGYLYVTDQGSPNPYAILSSYFATLVDMVRQAGSTSAPIPNLVTILTLDSGGSPLPGLWATVMAGGETIAAGPSPLTFSGVVGTSYKVTLSDYGSDLFDHWSTGATTNSIALLPTQDSVIAAYYQTGAKVYVSVRTALVDGRPLSGIYTTVSRGSELVASGYAPVAFRLVPDTQYNVTVSNYAGDLFYHWGGGEATRSLLVAPTGNTSITAYFVNVAPEVGRTTDVTTGSVLRSTSDAGSTVGEPPSTPSHAPDPTFTPLTFMAVVVGAVIVSAAAVMVLFRERRPRANGSGKRVWPRLGRRSI